jgi:hypothetical protein
MRTTYKFLGWFLAFLISGGCAEMHSTILEAKDVQFFKVEELQAAQPVKLRISGLAFNSAMSVKKITTKIDGSVITVQVQLALARPGTSGSFAYELTVPDSVSEVRFGKGTAPVWKRGGSSPLRPK